jgi:soluble lytic murein transglycosylase-like protein
MAAMRSAPVPALLVALSLATLLWALLPADTARADIYRWVDKDGTEHYTNIQPAGRSFQRVVRGTAGPAITGVAKPRATATGTKRELRAPDPARTARYDSYIREAAVLYVLPEELVRAVMRIESNFYHEAVSHKGAMGLMQLMPATARAMGVLDPFDARQNVLGGARFLRVLANRFGGDLVLTIAAYNAGEGAVQKYRGIPPYAETRRYVQRVLGHYYELRAQTALRARIDKALARR